VQCGFCSPGMVISGLSHFLNGGGGGEQELARAIEGNLCRCTGYLRLLSGLERHAARLGGGVGLE
jgi:carbon-monoxide dehydrogenase small subunit